MLLLTKRSLVDSATSYAQGDRRGAGRRRFNRRCTAAIPRGRRGAVRRRSGPGARGGRAKLAFASCTQPARISISTGTGRFSAGTEVRPSRKRTCTHDRRIRRSGGRAHS